VRAKNRRFGENAEKLKNLVIPTEAGAQATA